MCTRRTYQQTPHTPPRAVEARVEALAARALGTRATAVRAFRRPLPSVADPAAGAPGSLDPSAHAILLAAQVCFRD